MGRVRFPDGACNPYPGGFGHRPAGLLPVCQVLAALVPERVLPFGSGDSRKRGPKPSRGQALGVVPRWGAERRGRRRSIPRRSREEAMVLAAFAGRLFLLRRGGTRGALFGAPPPFFWEALEGLSCSGVARLGCEAASRERGRLTLILRCPRHKRGPRRMRAEALGPPPSRRAGWRAPQDDGNDACVPSS
jgi:hypothetical protein